MKYCSKIIVISNKENKGYPTSINQGLKIAFKKNIKYFLITNNDVWFYPQAINELLKFARNSKYGYLTAVDKKRNWKYVKDLLIDEWEGLCNSCFMLKKETIDNVGYYDENFGLGGEEDRDYLQRIGVKGIETRAYRKALIEHEHGYTQELVGSNTPDKLRKNRKYLEDKHKIKVGWRFD